MLVETTTFLGPVRVLETDGLRVHVRLPDRSVWAWMALPYGYHPAEGDLLLVLGQGDDHYVVGVLSGRGTSILTTPGNLELRAPCGRIELQAADGVTVRGRRIALTSQELEVTAEKATERFGESFRWVQDTLQVRAGRLREVVQGDYSLRADRIRQIAQRDVRIDGRSIDLG